MLHFLARYRSWANKETRRLPPNIAANVAWIACSVRRKHADGPTPRPCGKLQLGHELHRILRSPFATVQLKRHAI